MSRARMWGVCGLVAPGLFAVAILPDSSVSWGLFAPLSFLCFVGWLITGITLFARTARAAAWGLYVLVLPAAFCAWIIPGYTTVARSVAIGLLVYVVFWLLGGAAVVATRRGWMRPT